VDWHAENFLRLFIGNMASGKTRHLVTEIDTLRRYGNKKIASLTAHRYPERHEHAESPTRSKTLRRRCGQQGQRSSCAVAPQSVDLRDQVPRLADAMLPMNNLKNFPRANPQHTSIGPRRL